MVTRSQAAHSFLHSAREGRGAGAYSSGLSGNAKALGLGQWIDIVDSSVRRISLSRLTIMIARHFCIQFYGLFYGRPHAGKIRISPLFTPFDFQSRSCNNECHVAYYRATRRCQQHFLVNASPSETLECSHNQSDKSWS